MAAVGPAGTAETCCCFQLGAFNESVLLTGPPRAWHFTGHDRQARYRGVQSLLRLLSDYEESKYAAGLCPFFFYRALALRGCVGFAVCSIQPASSLELGSSQPQQLQCRAHSNRGARSPPLCVGGHSAFSRAQVEVDFCRVMD